MKTKILILFSILINCTVKGQIGVSLSWNGLVNIKTNPANKNGFLARVAYSTNRSKDTIYSQSITLNLNYLYRFAYHQDYNLYTGIGGAFAFGTVRGERKSATPVLQLPILGMEVRPFKKNQKWVLGVETGLQLSYFNEKLRHRPNMALDFTYFLKDKKKFKK
jgi:hypothetical protein